MSKMCKFRKKPYKKLAKICRAFQAVPKCKKSLQDNFRVKCSDKLTNRPAG